MFSRLFKKKDNKMLQKLDNSPTAYPINCSGKGTYKKSFQNGDFGVIFEDDGKTGYFYATNGDNKEILDSLLLYNYSDANYIPEGQIFIVLNEHLKKAGIFYNNQFQAIFDFENKKGCSRISSQVLENTKWKEKHDWDNSMTIGLEP